MSTPGTGAEAKTPPPSAWRVAMASFAGTTIEYFDFSIYATAAALVFPTLFFPSEDPLTGLLAAFATFAIGFLSRPIGGIIFGHFGDRVGRKRMLVITLVLMGVATAAIGLIPSYASIGVAAPVLLVALRLIQGLAFGGEWGGAVLLAFESAPPERRGLFASLPHTGPPAGVLLGNLIFLPIVALPDEALFSWGWRVPFIASVVLVAFGLVVRLRITESPEFAHVQKSGQRARLPIWDALRHYPKQVLLVCGGFIGFGVFAIVGVTFYLGYATTTVGVDRQTILTIMLVTNVVQIACIPLAGALSDRLGRRQVILPGCVAAMAAAFALFLALDTGNTATILVGYIIPVGVLLSIGYGPLTAVFAASFPAHVRYSGMSLGFQIANVLGAAISPTIATLILRATGTSMAVSGYVTAMLLISLACLAILTRRGGAARESEASWPPHRLAGSADDT